MLFSMWNLYNSLTLDGVTPEASIISGKAEMDGFRLGQTGEKDMGSLTELPAGPTLRFGGDYITLPGFTLEEAANTLSALLDSYARWERESLHAIIHGRPMQELLQMAHQVIRRPMFIMSDSNWVIAITPGYGAETHPDWENLEASALRHAGRIEGDWSASMDDYFRLLINERGTATVIHSPFYGGNVLCTNVWVEDRRVCEIVVLEHGRPFNNGDVHFVKLLEEMVCHMLITTPDLFFEISRPATLMVRLLEQDENQGPGVNELASIRYGMGWQECEELAVIVVDDGAGCELPLSASVRDRLEGKLTACAFFFEGRVVCVAPVHSMKEYLGVQNTLRELVPEQAYSWGVSYEFSDLSQVRHFYRQALTIVQHCLKTHCYCATAYEVGITCLAEQLQMKGQFRSFIHPDLLRLQAADAEGGWYVETLKAYLLCAGNLTDTARMLNLHRNSVIYRVDRIKELMRTDPDDVGNRIQLLSSYLLLHS